VRPASEVDTALLRKLSPEMNRAVDIAIGRDDLFVAINDQDNAKALEGIRGSLGLISVGQALSEGRALKLLMLDGKAGTIETLRDGTYPYAKQLYVMVGSEPSPPVAAFLAFLFSAEGARRLTESGFLPTASVD
jgi:phosphate transport system substrate-binding protein